MTTGREKPLILIVDDVTENLQVLGNILNKNNYRISYATNGKEALNMLKKIHPDLILLDIMMPEMDGLETCRYLKADPGLSEIPVIFLTARTEQADLVQGFETGAVDYVKKPFNSAELLARIRTHVELRQARNTIAKLKEKEMFHAMVVTANHQINQPLTVLTLYLQMLEDDKDNVLSKKSKENITQMFESLNSIKNILKKLRSIQDPKYIKYLDNLKMVDMDK